MDVKQLMSLASRHDTAMAYAFYRACVVKLYGKDSTHVSCPPPVGMRGRGTVKYDKFTGIDSCFKQRHGVRGM